jgi:hypothetical protein
MITQIKIVNILAEPLLVKYAKQTQKHMPPVRLHQKNLHQKNLKILLQILAI